MKMSPAIRAALSDPLLDKTSCRWRKAEVMAEKQENIYVKSVKLEILFPYFK